LGAEKKNEKGTTKKARELIATHCVPPSILIFGPPTQTPGYLGRVSPWSVRLGYLDSALSQVCSLQYWGKERHRCGGDCCSIQRPGSTKIAKKPRRYRFVFFWRYSSPPFAGLLLALGRPAPRIITASSTTGGFNKSPFTLVAGPPRTPTITTASPCSQRLFFERRLLSTWPREVKTNSAPLDA